MEIILLSGGSGKRLWPLSNDIRSKQFLKIFKYNNQLESMVQRVYRQLKEADPYGDITIATSKSQVSSIRNQLGDTVNVCVEPCRRDTFPAIALAVSYLHYKKGVPLDEAIVVCPVDSYVEKDFFERIKKLRDLSKVSDGTNLFLIGINPTVPSEKYGYIIPKTNDEISTVLEFKEKPSEEKAIEYIKRGALWNGGVFSFKLGYILNIAKQMLGTNNYEELLSNYENFEKISFDYAVVEKEKEIGVLKYDGDWVDAGTWATLTDIMSEHIIGDAKADENCENVHIVNELDIPIIAIGVKNSVISASPDGILVTDKKLSANVKEYVEDIHREAMFAEKSWGAFKVVDTSDNSLTIKVNIKAGDAMNYHSHQFRDEVWVVTSGTGKAIVDGIEKYIQPGDVVAMKAGMRHTVFAVTELDLIEIQIGKDITVRDKIKYQLEKKD